MKKCPFCGKELLDNAEFCLYCMSPLKEKIPVTAKQPSYKKVVVGCLALCLAIIIAFIAFGNINAKNGNIKPQTDSNVSDGNVTSEPTDNTTENNQTEDNGLNSAPNQGGNSKPQNSQTPSGNEEISGGNDNIIENNGGSENNTQSGGGGVSGSDSNNNNSSLGTTPPAANDEVVKCLTYTIDYVDASPYKYALITDCDTELAGDVVIPSTIDGYEVAQIQGSAFADCTKITSITIPDSVTEIGTSAFYNCASLVKITLPKDANVGIGAFKNCTSLKEVVNSRYISLVNDYMFYGCSALEYIELSTSRISSYAFKDCKNLKTIKLSSNPWVVLENAFSGCTALKDIYHVEAIGRIDIDEGNEYFENATFHKID